MDAPRDFWWNNITGPHVFVTSVADALVENKMVLLKVPADLPWRHSMRGAIRAVFLDKTDSSEAVIEEIDMVDDNPENIEPGRFILNRYASTSISRGYRERSKVTIQEYIAAKKVIRNRILWVKGLTGKHAEKWIKFCRGFLQASSESGLFVLEIHGEIAISETHLLKYIDFSEYVSSYDVQLFNSLLLDGQKTYSNIWKNYISTSAALVSGTDVEISALLINIVDFRKNSVLDGIKVIAEMPEFFRRGVEGDSNHVLRHFRNNNMVELQHRMWCSQVQVLFPIIELERVKIVEKWKDNLQEALNHNSVTQYGESLKDARDIEIGSLCYMMKHRGNGGLYLLNIPEEEERRRIELLHVCRNRLAHAACCTPIQIAELLNVNK
ncbi:hypothetical protein [Eisenbergiella tayi]|uniref:hypothetical protein n=1 Tax=Eisenbergiella tayi TaxID=1432052 RepID=UPI000848792E|nr:hypothetical protein [Eisenbergiella tayi]ODR33158.1 hypothetical protein BEI60_26355 [Eisenbergiella tayi]